MVCPQKSSQRHPLQSQGISCYSLSIALNAFLFHSTKVLKRDYKSPHDGLLLAYFYYFPPCSLCSLLTSLLAHAKKVLRFSELEIYCIWNVLPPHIYVLTFSLPLGLYYQSDASPLTLYTVITTLPTCHASIMTT